MPFPASPTLVATPLPNSVALRVPYGNVSPSVSNSQIDNNASGNRNSLPKNIIHPPISANTPTENFSLSTISNPATFTANSQTAFFAQLASGDISPETYGIFAQYEKLLSYANVKYKPSNAGKPVEPVSLFSTILQQEKTTGISVAQTDEEIILPVDMKLTVGSEAVLSTPVENINTQPIILLKAYNVPTTNHNDIPVPTKLEFV